MTKKPPKPKKAGQKQRPASTPGAQKRAFNQLLDDAIFGVPKGKKRQP